ncbi:MULTISPECIES: alpha-1,4-glucan--maltose-1-phosphate maltosyltransferase [Flavobacteriaceae]|uniref:Alpha-1,4-glucan:maltose-1-phosphate maltosyltransferase n=2 Tax=Flavobacteriaceae TaxID=49546 RepID=A0A4Y8AXW4_9FLAO|nr:MULTISPECIES: alpha-1,4-glucan--maltose-1-phosphate maltosyltransferase [Flavobacteriaceae]TEW76822.1 alpha-1,4-glucan--maltose-1-phosphate maltosyltransferase [Gramella jeungdoensis]GGK49731.1 alpha-1,4-glucan:maltose-1-phosphate maltosyltransferase [Lutibacter litoralis]
MQKNQRRVVIENISPQLNNGDFQIKRVVNEIVTVNADVLTDGHDIIASAVLYKHEKAKEWSEVRMQSRENNNWQASFTVENQGSYTYKIIGWVDYALNWQQGIHRKIDDNQIVHSELLEGIDFLKKCSRKATASEKKYLKSLEVVFADSTKYDNAVSEAISDKLHTIFLKYPEKKLVNTSKELPVYVDRIKARFSTWYEFFPRSASQNDSVHGTFKDCEKLLPKVVEMGFDTLYFPPVHPIGEVKRKGKNNTTEAKDGDVGSCWGIGSKLGGHKSIHPQLGTVKDFKTLIKKASNLGIEIAMDYALQAAPDHPWVKEYPSWFKWRPDGTVQYAENPPKKYQDILPIYWESEDYKNLWDECLDTLYYWIDCGIKVFRVDNPHTKPFYFWNWIISEVKAKHPDTLFLAEAFTAPKIMQQLAKQGYTQSYTYFTWRNNKHELTEYVEELTKTDQKEYMRPNFWPNTPDINPFHLQGANESKYIQRYVLAATLSSNIGIYGPVFEQMIDEPIIGKEEYLNSEKFQICKYDWFKQNKLTSIISKVNKIRNNHKALQQTNNIKFCSINNDNLIAFYKWDDTKENELLIIISLDEYHTQQGMLKVPLHELGIGHGHHLKVTDLITEITYDWHDEWNFIQLQTSIPFHIFKITK